MFETYQDAFEELLETTVDLRQLGQKAMEILKNEALSDALRYLPGPPISLDDLKVLAEAPSISPAALRADPGLASRIVETVMMGLDRRRFPWVAENREATEQERASAILASTAMLASRRVETERRNEGKEKQEQAVRAALKANDFREVDRRTVTTLSNAPKPGTFCMESMFGSDKADLLIGLWDERVMPLECKVSNSATNSIKRLNKDAAVKAVRWREDFGANNVMPAALLAGVYKLKNLEAAQERGLVIFWSHSLDELLAFIDLTKRLEKP